MNVKLPHGLVPTGAIKDPSVRDAVMKQNENTRKLLELVNDLRSRLETLERGG